MRLGFCLFKYFPYGGLQRDFLKIARRRVAEGDRVYVYTMDWKGDLPDGLNLRLIPCRGLTNHGRCRRYHKRAAVLMERDRLDRVIGFDRMPGLNIYFGADTSFKAKGYGLLRRLTPRYRHFMRFERAVFDPQGRTHILALVERQKLEYQRQWGTPDERFTLLPPGISRLACASDESARLRRQVRAEFGVADDELLLLMVASSFKTKGLDRALRALHSLPQALKGRVRLLAVGQQARLRLPLVAGGAGRYGMMMRRLRLRGRVEMAGARDDIPAVMQAADVLLHPAYLENTGTVLLEAVVAGLPVITTDVCGFAHHIRDAEAGVVVSGSPFRQRDLNQALLEVLTSPHRPRWRENGIRYGRSQDLYGMVEAASNAITRLST